MEQAIETINGVNVKTKVCTKCGKELPITQFSLNPKSHDGRLSICKTCHSQSIAAGHAKKKEAKSMALPIKGIEGGNPELAKFTPRQLMEELRSRGFEGELTYVYRIKL